MPGFRYAQYCPLARAVEILGERWTMLVVRELMLGPKRFTDLRRPLSGISASVLADRLSRLEERGVVVRRSLPPPTPAVLYELAESGRALLPALIELGRWGARFLGAPEPEDRLEPEWLRLGLLTFARRTATPAASFAISIADGDREVALHVSGGRKGTAVRDGSAPADVSIRAGSPLAVLALAAGWLDPREAIRTGQIRAEGDLELLGQLPALFEMNREDGPGAEPLGPPPQPRGD